jgi:hypothetical protein
MAKQQSFADKAAKKKKKNLSTYVKYIKSVKSEKTGYWRFNEQMIEVKEGENLDGALKRMDEVAQVFNMEIPVIESAADVDTVEQDGSDEPKDHDQTADDNGQEELADIVAEESVTEVNEPASDEQVEAEPEPETDDTATTEDDQESGATEGEEATVEKENDADETVEPATEDVGSVTEKQAEDADALGKDTSAKADESA